MSDNPFAEPDDSDRTVVRGAGPRRARRMPAGRARRCRRRASPPGTPPRPAGPRRAWPARRRRCPRSASGRSPPPRRRCSTCSPASPAGGAGQPQPGRAARARHRARCAASRRRRAPPGSAPDEIRAAHYVLCAALDDVVLATPWGQASGWCAHSLVSTFHQEVKSGDRFFDMLSGMQKDPGALPPGAGGRLPLPLARAARGATGCRRAARRSWTASARGSTSCWCSCAAPGSGSCRRIGAASTRRIAGPAAACPPGSPPRSPSSLLGIG